MKVETKVRKVETKSLTSIPETKMRKKKRDPTKNLTSAVKTRKKKRKKKELQWNHEGLAITQSSRSTKTCLDERSHE